MKQNNRKTNRSIRKVTDIIIVVEFITNILQKRSLESDEWFPIYRHSSNYLHMEFTEGWKGVKKGGTFRDFRDNVHLDVLYRLTYSLACFQFVPRKYWYLHRNRPHYSSVSPWNWKMMVFHSTSYNLWNIWDIKANLVLNCRKQFVL